MATPNPLENTNSSGSPAVKSVSYHIGGILTTVYGLEELSSSVKSVACLWLLHPRLQTKEIMANIASNCILDFNNRDSLDHKVGLIAVAFDQRNHGTREVTPLANEAWRSGNETHAQDMFSIIHGTVIDTSLLIDHLGSYIFQAQDAPTIEQHIVLGISLGGHAAWQVLFNDPRVTSGVIVIGCPDYMRVMIDRARLSKLSTYSKDDSSSFLGSKYFPRALISSIERWDPRGLLFSTSDIDSQPSEPEKVRLRRTLDSRIKNKRFLICSGAVDKLVPYHCSKPFLDFLKEAVRGWYRDGNVYLEDIVYENVGHAFSAGMEKDAIKFVGDAVVEYFSCGRSASKI